MVSRSRSYAMKWLLYSAVGFLFLSSVPMATSKSPTCGRVKIPHPGDSRTIAY